MFKKAISKIVGESGVNVVIAVMIAGMSIMPTAIYGLFHTDSIAFQVTKFVFALNR